MQRPLDIVGDEEGTSATMLETPPGSMPGSVSSKPGAWKQSVKSKKPHVLASLIASGKPEDMPVSFWGKVQ